MRINQRGRIGLPYVLAAVAVFLALHGPAWPESDKEQGLMMVDCPDRLMFNRESLSRTGIGIRLDRPGERCRIRGVVGGEHISYVGVTGRPGHAYEIVFTPIKGTPGYVVHWPATVSNAPGAGPNVRILTPADEAGIILAVSAHPFGKYELTVAHLPPEPAKIP